MPHDELSGEPPTSSTAAASGPSTPDASPARRVLVGVATALVVATGGLLLGGATSYGQTVLPDALRSLANSCGGWTLLAFALVRVVRARPGLAAALGVVAFEALVEGYGAVSGWRGFFYQRPFTGLFNLLGLVAGPVIGVSASLTRFGTPRWRTLAVAPPAAVLLGEGAYGLTVVAETTSPVWWTLQVLLGAAAPAWAAGRWRPGRRWVGLTAALTLTGAVAFLLGYARL